MCLRSATGFAEEARRGPKKTGTVFGQDLSDRVHATKFGFIFAALLFLVFTSSAPTVGGIHPINNTHSQVTAAESCNGEGEERAGDNVSPSVG